MINNGISKNILKTLKKLMNRSVRKKMSLKIYYQM